MQMNKKRCYHVHSTDGEYGYSIVASKSCDAKRMLAARIMDEEGCEWLDLRVQWLKNVRVDDKPIGYVFEDLIEGIGRGAYTYAECECPVCKHEADVKRWDDGSVSCEGCYEEKQKLSGPATSKRMRD
jgi:hypothetical protein